MGDVKKLLEERDMLVHKLSLELEDFNREKIEVRKWIRNQKN